MSAVADRVGLGWRPELAAGICAHIERIDLVEVIADDYFGAPRARLRALRTLAAQVPVTLHGVGLGLASSSPVERRRLEAIARLVETVRPESWSEHLAFVRAGGREIGHLAAPPRCAATIDGAALNLAAARAVVGSAPLVENVATLIDPPGSALPEDEWVARVLEASGADLLLDLHNLHANAANFGFDALAYLDRLPAERIRAVHLAGGRLIEASGGERRVLDDHLHAPPAAVFELLAEVARRVRQPLTVILERDGAYPPIESLLRELDEARAALRRGRATSLGTPRRRAPAQPTAGVVPIDEAWLARLYVDGAARRRFLADPRGEGRRQGLPEGAWAALERIDRVGLQLAADSYERKREGASGGRAGGLTHGASGL